MGAWPHHFFELGASNVNWPHHFSGNVKLVSSFADLRRALSTNCLFLVFFLLHLARYSFALFNLCWDLAGRSLDSESALDLHFTGREELQLAGLAFGLVLAYASRLLG